MQGMCTAAGIRVSGGEYAGKVCKHVCKTGQGAVYYYIKANFKSSAGSFEIFFGICRESVFGGYFSSSSHLKLLPQTARRFLSNLCANDF